MKRTNYAITAIFASVLLGWLAPVAANMATYSAEPVFISNSVPSNIMVILDNSGSMNYNAYGSYPGAGGTVNDEPFAGEGRSNLHSFPVVANSDDMEQTSLGLMLDGLLGGNDLAMGNNLVGIRFQNVLIPKGVTILSANIAFVADESGSTASTLTIDAQASDNAPAMVSLLPWNISSRAGTAATVTWNPVAWTSGDSYSTDSISTIVQELVNRAGWQSGNAMLFRISGSGNRVAESRESGIQYRAVLRVTYDDGNLGNERYYGYFSPDYFYSYGTDAFRYAYKKVSFNSATGIWNVQNLSGAATTLNAASIVSNKLWDGNWLNWLAMRRIDVLRKVLFGGDTRNGRDGTGNQLLYGEYNAGTYYKKTFDSSSCAVSPYLGSFSYQVRYDQINVSSTNYYIRVEKQIAREPADFFKYDNGDNLAGVLQKIGDETVRWGNMWFRTGTGSGLSGGYVENPIGTSMVTLIKAFEAKNPDTWTPLAETLYVAMQYFRQEQPAGGLDYYSLAVPNAVKGDSDDPYYQSGAVVRCAKSFVLLLTDGASTKDAMIPSFLKDYAGDGDKKTCNESTETNCDYESGGTDFLDDVALYAHTTDLRTDIEDRQSFTLYTVYAFGNDENARLLLSSAAKNGGFEDQNGDKRPNTTSEWDADGNGVPDTYFEASDGYLLESQLMTAFGDMAQRIASATSASVLATNSEGEGTMLQSYFVARQANASNTKYARWLGYLQTLWVDGDGLLRDDSGPDLHTLDDNDKKVEFVIGEEGNTLVRIDGKDTALGNLTPIFEAGNRLNQRDVTKRAIFTFIDANRDGLADESTDNPLDQAGEVIAFNTASAAKIKPYLGVADNTLYGTLGMNLGATQDTRVANIIEWVRGTDIAGLRSRTLDGVTHRLGDIMHSTPVTVGKPTDQYHTLYNDKSYLDYWNAVKRRETMIYVGANDGMLHAFTSWQYTHDDQGRPTYKKIDGTSEELGDEIWAFIPQAVLPHLKWPAHANYSHTYLVDGRPRVFDAQILPDGTHYIDGDAKPNWGTFLVMGLRMGAKQISVTENFGAGVETRTFDPTYICLDITEPRHPRLMWERTYPGLGMSWSRPAPLKVGDRWYLTFGSGPTGYDATSNQPGYLYVADLATGAMLRRFGPIEAATTLGYFNDPTAFDKNLNYNVDAIYTTGSFLNAGAWQGGVYKIAIPCANCSWDSAYNPANDFGYDEDPNHWIYSKLFASDRPISAAVALSSEYVADKNIDNVWLYFGTGRYLVKGDVVNSDQQYLYGIKDPFFNSTGAGGYHDYTPPPAMDRGRLMRADTLSVTTGGQVLQGGTMAFNEFSKLEAYIQDSTDGWYRNLDDTGTGPSERVVSTPAILGGMVLTPVFTPDDDLCNYGGATNLLALYFGTGTGYFKQIFTILTPDTVLVDGNTKEVVAVKLPESFIGAPPSAAGFHAGQERGARSFLQQSTGQTVEIDVVPPFYFQGAIIDWWD